MFIDIIVAFLLAGSVSWFAFYKRWLNLGGAVAATVLGTLVWYLGGWRFSVPLVLFFVTGSLFDRLGKPADVPDKKYQKPRDYLQVICNGGVAGLFLLFYCVHREPIFIAAYFTSLAASTADTWSSSLGILYGGQVSDILSGKSLPKGTSGGVSRQGTFAGMAGSMVIALCFILVIDSGLKDAVVIFLGGCFGMLLDSVLGSRLQAKYQSEKGRIIEYRDGGNESRLVSGLAWMTNDLVNLASNLVTTIMAIIVLSKT